MLEIERIDLDALGVEVVNWSGMDNAICRCVFHDEKTSKSAHMSVNVVKGVFQCFSCGAKGSVNRIARKTGGLVSKRLEVLAPKKERTDFSELLKTPLAFDDPYLTSRGVTNGQVEKFSIHLTKTGIGFPLWNEFKEVVGVLIRHSNPYQKPRYQLEGEYPPVYPMENLQFRELFVTEGIFGVLSADRAKFPAVATLSASIRSETIWSIYPNRLFVCFDNDYSGYLGAAKLRVMNPEAKIVKPTLEADKRTVRDWEELNKSIENDDNIYLNGLFQLSQLSGDEAVFNEAVSRFIAKMKKEMEAK